jgi:aminoglycoside phosphotransferase (APT) family kinase protein
VTSTALLQLADEYVRLHGLPREPTVFVHGDIWPGNTRWLDGTFTALIDWKTAGVGSPGVDLGSLRMQVALRYGLDTADCVREGWEQQMGREASHIYYWDAVAALNTPTIMQGWPGCDPERHSLGSKAVTARRDAFLSQALDHLDVRRDRERQLTGWG